MDKPNSWTLAEAAARVNPPEDVSVAVLAAASEQAARAVARKTVPAGEWVAYARLRDCVIERNRILGLR